MKPPLEYTVIDLAKQRQTIYLDYRDTYDDGPRPHSLKCDYCCRASDRLWQRKTRGFGVTWERHCNMVNDPGSWGACVFCEPLVEARDLRTLVARVKTVNPTAKNVAADCFERMYAAVFSVFEDAPVLLWESGKPWPVEW